MDKIVVLDFGGQYAHLIANKIRRLGVYCEIKDGAVLKDELLEYKGIILSGGPASVRGKDSLLCDPGIFNLGVPILGICYGHQLVAHTLGGRVDRGDVREYGRASIHFSERKGIFEDLDESEDVWMSHFDQVVEAPPEFKVVGSTDDCEIAAMVNYEKNIYGIQFHPEVVHTPCGMRVLESFVELTNAKRDWDIDRYIENITEEIQTTVGEKKVFLMVSGGVDSTVAFLLLEKALGPDRVYGLFVDTGLLRLGERDQVAAELKEVGINNLHVYDASAEYFEALKGKYEPEEKRKIIGDLFLDIQSKVSDELGLNPEHWFLGQGTIYPDTIETGGTKHAHTIKTHHNQVPRVLKMKEEGKVIEPLEQLYKDEVRMVGEKLGLSKKMVWRHPFPGPGLGVRTLCMEQPENLENLAAVEAKVNAILAGDGLKGKVLPIKSVGVQGDERTYRHPVVIYGERIEWERLNKLSTQLTNQVGEVNRVVLGLSPTDFSVITPVNAYLTPKRVMTLQKADKIVMDYILEIGVDRDIWQFPTVLIPVGIGSGESLVLRPVESTEAMTASFYQMDWEKLDELVKRLSVVEGVSGIFYDLTNKPPGTIEWE